MLEFFFGGGGVSNNVGQGNIVFRGEARLTIRNGDLSRTLFCYRSIGLFSGSPFAPSTRVTLHKVGCVAVSHRNLYEYATWGKKL